MPKLYVISPSLQWARAFAQANGVSNADLVFVNDPMMTFRSLSGVTVYCVKAKGYDGGFKYREAMKKLHQEVSHGRAIKIVMIDDIHTEVDLNG